VARLQGHLAERRRRHHGVAGRHGRALQTIGPFWPLPTINTALLLTSGVTLTIAHHALIANQRSKTIFWMWITVLLGVIFLVVQAYEYMHAYRDLNLKLSSGIFGSTFFMLTGFHGFHVFVGMLMLLFITLRLMKGHFTPAAPLRLRGRRLVLALRRRGLARPVLPRVLALSAPAGLQRKTPGPSRGVAAWLFIGPPVRPDRNPARLHPAHVPAQQDEAGKAPPTAPRAAPARAPCGGCAARRPSALAQHEHPGAGQRPRTATSISTIRSSSRWDYSIARVSHGRADGAAALVVLLAALALAALTARLGVWQLDRAAQKTALQRSLDERRALPALPAAELARDRRRLHGAAAPPRQLQGRWLPSTRSTWTTGR
jgi:hypothetical protein